MKATPPHLEAPHISEPCLLLRISRLWRPTMSPEELFEATHGWWRVGPRRECARYALAVASGVVREVYRIEVWRPRHKGDRGWEDNHGDNPRWGFEGDVAADEMARYRDRDVSRYFQPGQANPVLYVNC
jgi:hypothetical protein